MKRKLKIKSECPPKKRGKHYDLGWCASNVCRVNIYNETDRVIPTDVLNILDRGLKEIIEYKSTIFIKVSYKNISVWRSWAILP